LGLIEKRARWVVRVSSELEAADFLISGTAFKRRSWKFKAQSKLGRGAFGSVYRAEFHGL